jgi:hypothetical protein
VKAVLNNGDGSVPVIPHAGRQFDFLAQPAADAFATALRFTLSVPGVHAAIVGTAKPERIAGNAELASSAPIPQAEFDAIRARWQAVAKPHWFGQE